MSIFTGRFSVAANPPGTGAQRVFSVINGPNARAVRVRFSIDAVTGGGPLEILLTTASGPPGPPVSSLAVGRSMTIIAHDVLAIDLRHGPPGAPPAPAQTPVAGTYQIEIE